MQLIFMGIARHFNNRRKPQNDSLSGAQRGTILRLVDKLKKRQEKKQQSTVSADAKGSPAEAEAASKFKGSAERHYGR